MVRLGPPSIALASLLTFLACQDAASAASSSLVGTWRLLSWELTDSAGGTSYPFGQSPEGQIIYTETGRMSAQVRRPDLPLDSLSDVSQVTSTFISYYGTYSIDAAAGTVTHHVQGSLRPSRLGTDQVRGFEMSDGDRLTLSAVTGSNPLNTTFPGSSELIWERVR